MLVNSHSICSLREREGFFHAAFRGQGGPPRHLECEAHIESGGHIECEAHIELRDPTRAQYIDERTNVARARLDISRSARFDIRSQARVRYMLVDSHSICSPREREGSRQFIRFPVHAACGISRCAPRNISRPWTYRARSAYRVRRTFPPFLFSQPCTKSNPSKPDYF